VQSDQKHAQAVAEPQRTLGRLDAGKPFAEVKRHCEPGDQTCPPRQRQTLLHWLMIAWRI